MIMANLFYEILVDKKFTKTQHFIKLRSYRNQ